MRKAIEVVRKKMDKASKEMEFLEAARFRDEMFVMEQMFKERFG